MECEESVFQNRASWRLDWVASSSCELIERPVWTFCLVVLQLAWRFNFSACFTRVHPLLACQSRDTRKIQLRVSASMHNLEHFFTLSHTLPLHDSHLNTWFLSAELQENWHGIKPTKWLIKFNLTVHYPSNFKSCILKLHQTLILFFWFQNVLFARRKCKQMGTWSQSRMYQIITW